MLDFLLSDPESNMGTRDRVDGYVGILIDELVQMAGEFHAGLEPGWSNDTQCELNEAERLWLDADRAELPGEDAFLSLWLRQDWPAQIGHRFGNWLNAQLKGKLPVGDIESRQWQKELLVDESAQGWAKSLHHAKKTLETPTKGLAKEGRA
jgi:CRISPR-associated protein Csy1